MAKRQEESAAPEAPNQYFSPDDELDLSGEGLQPTTGIFVITEADVVAHANGQRWVITYEPEEVIEGLPGGKAKDSGFLNHVSNEDAARIGRSILKRIGKAALGQDKFPMSALKGARVRATVSEDDAGFTRMGRYASA